MDATVGELLPPAFGTPSAAQQAIQVRHLLTMTGGFDWAEVGGGAMVALAVGGSLAAFADSVLFRPLGITRVAWEPLPGGQVNGGAGIDLRPRDLQNWGC